MRRLTTPNNLPLRLPSWNVRLFRNSSGSELIVMRSCISRCCDCVPIEGLCRSRCRSCDGKPAIIVAEATAAGDGPIRTHGGRTSATSSFPSCQQHYGSEAPTDWYRRRVHPGQPLVVALSSIRKWALSASCRATYSHSSLWLSALLWVQSWRRGCDTPTQAFDESTFPLAETAIVATYHIIHDRSDRSSFIYFFNCASISLVGSSLFSTFSRICDVVSQCTMSEPGSPSDLDEGLDIFRLGIFLGFPLNALPRIPNICCASVIKTVNVGAERTISPSQRSRVGQGEQC